MFRIQYYLAYCGFWLIAIVPFKILYLLSDILYLILYYLVGYRKKVVYTNLRNSFPEKSKQELKVIEKKFYHYLCDYMLESEKMLLLSEDELLRRMTFCGKELYLGLIEKYGGIVVLMPHYGNFEWSMGMSLYMKPGDVAVQVYKPIRNKSIDKLVLYIRSRFGGYNVPKHSTVREVVKLRRAGKKFVLALIADQSPSDNEMNVWTTFMNQETCFMDGGERIAKMMNIPVLYCDLKKTKRGYCEATFQLITDKPKETAEGEITKIFVQKVEQTILRDPAFWLWSHKRWKHKRQYSNEN